VTDGMIEGNFYRRMGSLLEAKRKQRGVSQTDVGSAIGVHRNTIMRWESGESAIDMWQLLRLADVLSCNHLLLLPSREFTWGTDLVRLERERDPLGRKPLQLERDPELTIEEVCREQGRETGYPKPKASRRAA
jgi:transcriptional regulator with XRE-family HTH domain